MVHRCVGVVMGGSSAEREVSLNSGRAVAQALEDAGHDVMRVELGPDSDAWQKLRGAKLDVAFLALHGRLGEDGCVQGMLELLGVPYTGSGVLASALAMDKLKSKELFRLHNVPTPPYYVVDSSEHLDDLREVHGGFGFPVVVKPRREGSSVGIGKASSMAELKDAIFRSSEHESSTIRSSSSASSPVARLPWGSWTGVCSGRSRSRRARVCMISRPSTPPG